MGHTRAAHHNTLKKLLWQNHAAVNHHQILKRMSAADQPPEWPPRYVPPSEEDLGSSDSMDIENFPVQTRPRRATFGSSVETEMMKVLPVTICFSNLFYSVKSRSGKNPFKKKEKKVLLKDITGEMRPGEVTAIMGPSGFLSPRQDQIVPRPVMKFNPPPILQVLAKPLF